MADTIINGINTAYLPSSFVQNGTIVDQQQAAQVASGVAAKLQDMPPAEQALFLAAIQSSPDLTPDTVSQMNSGQISDAISRLAGALAGGSGTADGLDFASSATNAMSWLFGGGMDETALLGKLIIQQAASEEKSALEDRTAARDIATGDLLAQAADAAQSASEMISGAITSLVVSCVTAAVSLGFAAKEGQSISAMSKNVKSMQHTAEELQDVNNELKNLKKVKVGMGTPESDADKLTLKKIDKKIDELTEKSDELLAQKAENEIKGQQFNVDSQKAGQWNNFETAANSIGGGLGNFISQTTQGDAKLLDAQGDTEAAAAQYQQSEADKAKDTQQAFEDTISKIIAFLKDMQDAKADQMASLTKV